MEAFQTITFTMQSYCGNGTHKRHTNVFFLFFELFNCYYEYLKNVFELRVCIFIYTVLI